MHPFLNDHLLDLVIGITTSTCWFLHSRFAFCSDAEIKCDDLPVILIFIYYIDPARFKVPRSRAESESFLILFLGFIRTPTADMKFLSQALVAASMLYYDFTFAASSFSPARPPAIPIGVKSPYLSTWQYAGSDGGNGGYLAGQWPQFWAYVDHLLSN